MAYGSTMEGHRWMRKEMEDYVQEPMRIDLLLVVNSMQKKKKKKKKKTKKTKKKKKKMGLHELCLSYGTKAGALLGLGK
ncbi:hypothetical protein BHE74_00039013 [Ensete ventricosum]|nr:hypothetical protein BHE74_00039013 [Ensete ventricosum]